MDRSGVSARRAVHVRAQFCAYFKARRDRAHRFVHALLDRRHALEDNRLRLPKGARVCRISSLPLYQALGAGNLRPRKNASAGVLMRRLLSLDYVIKHPHWAWLPTEAEKVSAFEALGIPRLLLPQRRYRGAVRGSLRYFALKLPLALDSNTATFTYVDPGHDTEAGLRYWGRGHRDLWQALRQRGRCVRVVAIGRSEAERERAEKVLRRWTNRARIDQGETWRSTRLAEDELGR